MSSEHDSKKNRSLIRLCCALGAVALLGSLASGIARAQNGPPPEIEAQLLKIGHIVDPACTAKLYRPLMPKNDFNTYWPLGAPKPVFTGELYPGVTIKRDQSFGPDPKDVLDIFIGDKGGNNRPVLIYVPGGGGNKIEQQVRESNAFYDNIGRWATENGMIGVTVQRHQHPGGNWDDTGRDISMAVDYVYDNVKKYHGDPENIFIWAHSAGNGPLGMYFTHPDRWKNGVRVKGAIFMSGLPANVGGSGGGRGAGGARGAAAGNQPGALCGAAGMAGDEGEIAGPSGQMPAPPAAGGRGARGGRAQLTPQEVAERDNLPGLKAQTAKFMLAAAELDPGVTDGKMPAGAVALHDEICKLDGPNAKDGVGHCPAMLLNKGESHMSEVFSPDTNDKTVTGPVLKWIRSVMASEHSQRSEGKKVTAGGQ